MSKTNENENTQLTAATGFSEMTSLDFLSGAMNDECAGLDFSLDEDPLRRHDCL